MRRILVTGASGFIGFPCLHALKQRDFEIYAVTSRKVTQAVRGVTWLQADLHDQNAVAELMAKLRPTFMLHLAWYVEHGDFWRSRENLKWVSTSLNLANEFIKNGGKRLVAAGTCAEYDWSRSLCAESLTPLKPATLYGACKNGLQGILAALANDSGISFAWGRLFFPYGPNEKQQRLIPSMILSLLNRKLFSCKNPDLERDFIFVEDVADVFAALVDSQMTGPMNIGSGTRVKLKDVVGLIAAQLHAEHLVQYERPSQSSTEPPVLFADIVRLVEVLGNKPPTTLKDGLKQTINWWQTKLEQQRLGLPDPLLANRVR